MKPFVRPLLLALDPSSKCTGYAVLDARQDLVDGGLLKPNHRQDPANVRIEAMADDVRGLIAEYAPETVVIEDTSGKVNRKRHKGKGAGLAVYGKAIGWLIAVSKSCAKVRVETVLENKWTRGTSKRGRAEDVARMYPQYRPAADAGMDAADAIALGRWWLNEQKK